MRRPEDECGTEAKLTELLREAREKTRSYELVLKIDQSIGRDPLPPPGPCPECAKRGQGEEYAAG